MCTFIVHHELMASFGHLTHKGCGGSIVLLPNNQSMLCSSCDVFVVEQQTVSELSEG